MSDFPKVTQADVDAAIKKTEFVLLPDGRTTICMLTLDNGFTIRGESSCVDIRNYQAELGERFSLQDATNKVWAFLGFRLADQIKANQGNWIDRLVEETEALEKKTSKLADFVDGPLFKQMPAVDQTLLKEQMVAMSKYLNVLTLRLNRINRKA